MGRPRKIGEKTKPCVHCGEPTTLEFNLKSVDITGKKTIIQKIPTHKKCVRPTLARKRSLWTKIR